MLAWLAGVCRPSQPPPDVRAWLRFVRHVTLATHSSYVRDIAVPDCLAVRDGIYNMTYSTRQAGRQPDRPVRYNVAST